MTKVVLRVAIMFVPGLVGACGSNATDQVTPEACVKPADPGCRIAVHENSFVRWTGPGTDAANGGASTAVVRYAPGRFCMSGTVDAGTDGVGWGAIMAVGLDEVDEANRVTPSFDASALGVGQIRFNLETPPSSGVLLQITQIQSLQCTQIPDCVTTFGRSTLVASPGIFTVPWTDFNMPDAGHPSAILDRALITGVHFYVPTSPGTAVGYAFCISSLAFLDAGGHVLTP
jgi:hypothetical protein